MKNSIRLSKHFFSFYILTAFFVASCSTTGMQRSQAVQSSLETVDNDIKSIVVQLDAINSSLDQLTRPGQQDLKNAFDLFSENASKIKGMQKDFDKHAKEMEESGKAYFSKWDSDKQSYDNPNIQQRSDERRAALGDTYDRIAQNNIGVKEAFQTYVSDINEIQRFLSNDLTSEGVRAINNVANNVVENGSNLKYELQNLQAAIEDARIEMRQG